MAKVLKWEDETNPGQSSGNKREYLKIESNIEYRLRPVEYPVEFERFYNRDSDGKLYSAIAGPADECPIRNKYDMIPNKRYAMNMIDRSDGVLKIVEFPFTVYKELKTWGVNRQNEPGGKDGTDFLIKKTGSGQKGTKWSCKAVKDVRSAPWTGADKEAIEGNGGLYKLREIYAATPADRIEERLGLVVGSAPSEEPKVDSVNTVDNDLGVGGVDPGFGEDNSGEESVVDIGF